MLLGRNQKVVLVDYDGPLAKDMKLDSRAFARLKELAAQGFRIAIITGRSPSRAGDITNALEEFGLWKSAKLFCEHGSIEVKRTASGQYEEMVHGELTNYQRNERKTVREELLRLAKKHGFSKALMEGTISLYIGCREVNFPLGAVRKIVREAVEGINASGRLRTKLIAVPTAAGIEVLPAIATKRLAAERFLSGFRKKCRGFAFGDMPLDKKMAKDSGIKFIEIKSPEEFLRQTENLPAELRKRSARLRALLRKRARGKRGHFLAGFLSKVGKRILRKHG